MAIGLDQKRRREAEEARVRAEMVAANRRAEAEEAEWRATMAAIIAAAEAARQTKKAIDSARLTRIEEKLEPKVAPPPASLDMAKLKQADYAAGEAWEAGRQEREAAQAYAAYRAGEVVSEAFRRRMPVEKPWWESALDWVDQHQVEIAIGIGVVVAVGAIVLTGGVGLPVVAAILAAGAVSAAGTVGLNAHYDRPLGQNVLRNGGVSLISGAVTAGAWALVTGGLVAKAGIAVGNTATLLCTQYPSVCARVETGLRIVDAIEETGLVVKGTIQSLTGDSQGAADTAFELSLERADGGVPGNTVASELGDTIATYGDEALELVQIYGPEAAGLAARYGNEGIEFIERHGEAGLAFLAGHGDDAFALVALHGDDVVAAFARYGDEGVAVVEDYGVDFVRRSEKLGVDPTEVLNRPPGEEQTLEGWLLGISARESPVNQPLVFNLSEDTISAVAETSVHNLDSPLFAIGFGGGEGVDVPYGEFAKRHNMGQFAAQDQVWRQFAEAGAYGDFWQVNSGAIELAMMDRKIFVLNVPYREAVSKTGRYTLPEIRLIESGNYLRRTVGGYDFLVPAELVDDYMNIVQSVSPNLLAP
jgi:hypothetical protein